MSEMNEIVLSVDEVKAMLAQVDGMERPLREFFDQMHYADLCRDWLKLRARGADYIISERWALIDQSGNPVKDTKGSAYEHPSREYLEKMYGDRGYRIGLVRTVVVAGTGENTQNERKD